MWHSILQVIAQVLLSPLLVVASMAGYHMQTNSEANSLTTQMAHYEDLYLARTLQNEQNQPTFGTTQPFAGQTYNLAGSGVSGTAVSIILTSLTIKQTGQPILTADLVGSGGTFYVTIEPGSNTRQEIVGCTGVTQSGTTATLTGCSRGLAPITPYTASTTLQFTHAGGSQVIFSDPPQLFNQYAALGNSQTVTGLWNFTTTPTVANNAVNPTDVVNYATLLATSIAGAGTSTFSAMGISRLATSLQIASGTASSSNGFQGGSPLVIASKFATTTPGTLCNGSVWNCIPVAQVSGFLSQAWLNLTQAFTFSTTTHYTANIGTLTATTTYSFPPTGMFNNVSYTWPTSQGVASTTLINNGSGTLSWDSPGSKLYATSTHSRVHSNNTVFDTLFSTTTIPGNMLGTSNAIRITIPYIQYKHVDAGSGGGSLTISLNYGSAAAVCTAQFSTASAIGSLVPMDIVATIGAGGVTNDEFCTLKIGVYANGQTQLAATAAGGGYYFVSNGETTIDDTVAQTVTITATWSAASSNNSIQNINGAIIERIY